MLEVVVEEVRVCTGTSEWEYMLCTGTSEWEYI